MKCIGPSNLNHAHKQVLSISDLNLSSFWLCFCQKWKPKSGKIVFRFHTPPLQSQYSSPQNFFLQDGLPKTLLPQPIILFKLFQKLTGCCPNRFHASTSSAWAEKSNDLNISPFALSLSKGKRLVWATACWDITPKILFFCFITADKNFHSATSLFIKLT